MTELGSEPPLTEVARILRKLNFRRNAFFYAGVHFLISIVLAAFCWSVAFGLALSDAYYPDPPSLKIAEVLLCILQVPAFLLYWLTTKFSSSSVIWNSGTAGLLLILGSFLFGLTLRWIGTKTEK